MIFVVLLVLKHQFRCTCCAVTIKILSLLLLHSKCRFYSILHSDSLEAARVAILVNRKPTSQLAQQLAQLTVKKSGWQTGSTNRLPSLVFKEPHHHKKIQHI